MIVLELNPVLYHDLYALTSLMFCCQNLIQILRKYTIFGHCIDFTLLNLLDFGVFSEMKTAKTPKN